MLNKATGQYAYILILNITPKKTPKEN